MTFLCHRHTGLRWNRGSINFVRALAAAKCEFRRTDFCTCRTKSVPIGRRCLSDPFAEHVMSRYELPRLGVLRPERIAAKKRSALVDRVNGSVEVHDAAVQMVLKMQRKRREVHVCRKPI